MRNVPARTHSPLAAGSMARLRSSVLHKLFWGSPDLEAAAPVVPQNRVQHGPALPRAALKNSLNPNICVYTSIST
jgi:hypothetical protein